MNADLGTWWCGSCGNHAVLSAFAQCIERQVIPSKDLCLVSGVGCSGKLPMYVNAYAMHGLHGRTLPLATGVKLANPDLHVVAIGGDADMYSIGLSHLLHAAKHDVDVTCIVLDNGTLALTEGQRFDRSSSSTPYSSGLALVLSAGASFVARCISSDVEGTAGAIAKAMTHRGFSVVEVHSTCSTFHPEFGWEHGDAPWPVKTTGDILQAFEMLTRGSCYGVIYERAGARRQSLPSVRRHHMASVGGLDDLVAAIDRRSDGY